MKKRPSCLRGRPGVRMGLSAHLSQEGTCVYLLAVAGVGRCRRLCLGGSRLQRIGQQLHVDAAVLGTAGRILVLSDWIIFTQPDDVDPVGRNIVLSRKILNHSVGTATAQL